MATSTWFILYTTSLEGASNNIKLLFGGSKAHQHVTGLWTLYTISLFACGVFVDHDWHLCDIGAGIACEECEELARSNSSIGWHLRMSPLWRGRFWIGISCGICRGCGRTALDIFRAYFGNLVGNLVCFLRSQVSPAYVAHQGLCIRSSRPWSGLPLSVEVQH